MTEGAWGSVAAVAVRRSVASESFEFAAVEPDPSATWTDVDLDSGVEGDVECRVEAEWTVHLRENLVVRGS